MKGFFSLDAGFWIRPTLNFPIIVRGSSTLQQGRNRGGMLTPRHKFKQNVRYKFQKLYHECLNADPY